VAGVTIHGEHPFMPPEGERSAVRRFRSRLPSPVTLWTSVYDGRRAGLTVSSIIVADGEPGFVIGVLDPDSDLCETIRASSRAVVGLLDDRHRGLADAFGYVAPAPGGPFKLGEWTDTDWGPALAGVTWAGCELAVADPSYAGWGLQVRMEIRHVEIADADARPIVHQRGRYFAI
jgi:flavin reductase (DIM6/NTAB) family NADH-FMN oxidoreductase RutF